MSWATRHKINRRIWDPIRKQVLDAANWRCRVCGGFANEVDHVRPLHRGGARYDKHNLQVLCRSHHMAKTAKENRRQLTGAELEWRKFAKELAC